MTEKYVTEFHGMLKTVKESIKKKLNYVMMVQKERKKGSVGRLPMAKARKRFSMGPQALSLRQKVSLPLLLMRNASTARRRDIGLGTIRSTWSIRRRRRREVRFPLQV
jgi:hypothetical protein